MFSIKDVVQLQSSETVELVERRSLRSVAGSLLAAALLIVLPFFFLFSLIRAGGAGAIVLCLLLASGIAAALRAFVIWDSQVLIVTDRRVVSVEQSGVWKRHVQEMALPDVREANAKGQVLRIHGTGPTALIEVPKMPAAKSAASKIMDLKAPVR